MDWDKLRVFHAVALAGSFTHAGEELNLSQSAVSRQISALEEDLSVQLFHRHARGLKMTEQGETLYKAAHDVFDRLSLARAQIADSRSKPSGQLRITTTVGFGTTWLTPHMKDFMELYPDIQVELICDDRELDLGMREADVAIRLNEPTQPDLIKRRLFTITSHIYGSPEYLRQHGRPTKIEDLGKHKIIAYGDHAPTPLASVNWVRSLGLKGRNKRRVDFQVNNIYGLLLSVESGMGLASLPDYMVRGNKKIERVLPTQAGPELDCYFVYPEELRNMKRLTAFRDYLMEQVRLWQEERVLEGTGKI